MDYIAYMEQNLQALQKQLNKEAIKMKYIDIANIGFKYESEPVLENISFQVSAGEFIILTGENGAAKSTLLRIILGILQPDKGSVTFSKKNTDGGRLLVGYVPQQIASFNAGFPSTVLELVRSGRFPNGKWFKRLTEKIMLMSKKP